jgi:hypothetical protein
LRASLLDEGRTTSDIHNFTSFVQEGKPLSKGKTGTQVFLLVDLRIADVTVYFSFVIIQSATIGVYLPVQYGR